MPFVIHSKALILRGVTSFNTSPSSFFQRFSVGSLPQRQKKRGFIPGYARSRNGFGPSIHRPARKTTEVSREDNKVLPSPYQPWCRSDPFDARMANLEKTRTSPRYHPPRPWRSKEESQMIRRFSFLWFTCCNTNKPSGRSWAKQLGVSHTWLQKLVRESQKDPNEMWTQDVLTPFLRHLDDNAIAGGTWDALAGPLETNPHVGVIPFHGDPSQPANREVVVPLSSSQFFNSPPSNPPTNLTLNCVRVSFKSSQIAMNRGVAPRDEYLYCVASASRTNEQRM